MQIGEKIKKYRRDKNLTQMELGQLIGRSEISIRKYESSSTIPSIKILLDIANALEITLKDLTEDAEDQEVQKPTLGSVISRQDVIMVTQYKLQFMEELINLEQLHEKIDPKYLELLYHFEIRELRNALREQKQLIELKNTIINELLEQVRLKDTIISDLKEVNEIKTTLLTNELVNSMMKKVDEMGCEAV